MIVMCGRCDAEPVVLDGVDGVSWFGHTSERPWCTNCIRYAVLRWPTIGTLVATPVRDRRVRDADTCGMGDERECKHGVRSGRYCNDCDMASAPGRPYARQYADASDLAHRFGPTLGELFDRRT